MNDCKTNNDCASTQWCQINNNVLCDNKKLDECYKDVTCNWLIEPDWANDAKTTPYCKSKCDNKKHTEPTCAAVPNNACEWDSINNKCKYKDRGNTCQNNPANIDECKITSPVLDAELKPMYDQTVDTYQDNCVERINCTDGGTECNARVGSQGHGDETSYECNNNDMLGNQFKNKCIKTCKQKSLLSYYKGASSGYNDFCKGPGTTCQESNECKEGLYCGGQAGKKYCKYATFTQGITSTNNCVTPENDKCRVFLSQGECTGDKSSADWISKFGHDVPHSLHLLDEEYYPNKCIWSGGDQCISDCSAALPADAKSCANPACFLKNKSIDRNLTDNKLANIISDEYNLNFDIGGNWSDEERDLSFDKLRRNQTKQREIWDDKRREKFASGGVYNAAVNMWDQPSLTQLTYLIPWLYKPANHKYGGKFRKSRDKLPQPADDYDLTNTTHTSNNIYRWSSDLCWPDLSAAPNTECNSCEYDPTLNGCANGIRGSCTNATTLNTPAPDGVMNNSRSEWKGNITSSSTDLWNCKAEYLKKINECTNVNVALSSAASLIDEAMEHELAAKLPEIHTKCQDIILKNNKGIIGPNIGCGDFTTESTCTGDCEWFPSVLEYCNKCKPPLAVPPAAPSTSTYNNEDCPYACIPNPEGGCYNPSITTGVDCSKCEIDATCNWKGRIVGPTQEFCTAKVKLSKTGTTDDPYTFNGWNINNCDTTQCNFSQSCKDTCRDEILSYDGKDDINHIIAFSNFFRGDNPLLSPRELADNFEDNWGNFESFQLNKDERYIRESLAQAEIIYLLDLLLERVATKANEIAPGSSTDTAWGHSILNGVLVAVAIPFFCKLGKLMKDGYHKILDYYDEKIARDIKWTPDSIKAMRANLAAQHGFTSDPLDGQPRPTPPARGTNIIDNIINRKITCDSTTGNPIGNVSDDLTAENFQHILGINDNDFWEDPQADPTDPDVPFKTIMKSYYKDYFDRINEFEIEVGKGFKTIDNPPRAGWPGWVKNNSKTLQKYTKFCKRKAMQAKLMNREIEAEIARLGQLNLEYVKAHGTAEPVLREISSQNQSYEMSTLGTKRESGLQNQPGFSYDEKVLESITNAGKQALMRKRIKNNHVLFEKKNKYNLTHFEQEDWLEHILIRKLKINIPSNPNISPDDFKVDHRLRALQKFSVEDADADTTADIMKNSTRIQEGNYGILANKYEFDLLLDPSRYYIEKTDSLTEKLIEEITELVTDIRKEIGKNESTEGLLNRRPKRNAAITRSKYRNETAQLIKKLYLDESGALDPEVQLLYNELSYNIDDIREALKTGGRKSLYDDTNWLTEPAGIRFQMGQITNSAAARNTFFFSEATPQDIALTRLDRDPFVINPYSMMMRLVYDHDMQNYRNILKAQSLGMTDGPKLVSSGKLIQNYSYMKERLRAIMENVGGNPDFMISDDDRSSPEIQTIVHNMQQAMRENHHQLTAKFNNLLNHHYEEARVLLDSGPLHTFIQGRHLNKWIYFGEKVRERRVGFGPAERGKLEKLNVSTFDLHDLFNLMYDYNQLTIFKGFSEEVYKGFREFMEELTDSVSDSFKTTMSETNLAHVHPDENPWEPEPEPEPEPEDIGEMRERQTEVRFEDISFNEIANLDAMGYNFKAREIVLAEVASGIGRGAPVQLPEPSDSDNETQTNSDGDVEAPPETSAEQLQRKNKKIREKKIKDRIKSIGHFFLQTGVFMAIGAIDQKMEQQFSNLLGQIGEANWGTMDQEQVEYVVKKIALDIRNTFGSREIAREIEYRENKILELMDKTEDEQQWKKFQEDLWPSDESAWAKNIQNFTEQLLGDNNIQKLKTIGSLAPGTCASGYIQAGVAAVGGLGTTLASEYFVSHPKSFPAVGNIVERSLHFLSLNWFSTLDTLFKNTFFKNAENDYNTICAIADMYQIPYLKISKIATAIHIDSLLIPNKKIENQFGEPIEDPWFRSAIPTEINYYLNNPELAYSHPIDFLRLFKDKSIDDQSLVNKIQWVQIETWLEAIYVNIGSKNAGKYVNRFAPYKKRSDEHRANYSIPKTWIARNPYNDEVPTSDNYDNCVVDGQYIQGLLSDKYSMKCALQALISPYDVQEKLIDLDPDVYTGKERKKHGKYSTADWTQNDVQALHEDGRSACDIYPKFSDMWYMTCPRILIQINSAPGDASPAIITWPEKSMVVEDKCVPDSSVPSPPTKEECNTSAFITSPSHDECKKTTNCKFQRQTTVNMWTDPDLVTQKGDQFKTRLYPGYWWNTAQYSGCQNIGIDEYTREYCPYSTLLPGSCDTQPASQKPHDLCFKQGTEIKYKNCSYINKYEPVKIKTYCEALPDDCAYNNNETVFNFQCTHGPGGGTCSNAILLNGFKMSLISPLDIPEGTLKTGKLVKYKTSTPPGKEIVGLNVSQSYYLIINYAEQESCPPNMVMCGNDCVPPTNNCIQSISFAKTLQDALRNPPKKINISLPANYSNGQIDTFTISKQCENKDLYPVNHCSEINDFDNCYNSWCHWNENNECEDPPTYNLNKHDCLLHDDGLWIQDRTLAFDHTTANGHCRSKNAIKKHIVTSDNWETRINTPPALRVTGDSIAQRQLQDCEVSMAHRKSTCVPRFSDQIPGFAASYIADKDSMFTRADFQNHIYYNCKMSSPPDTSWRRTISETDLAKDDMGLPCMCWNPTIPSESNINQKCTGDVTQGYTPCISYAPKHDESCASKQTNVECNSEGMEGRCKWKDFGNGKAKCEFAGKDNTWLTNFCATTLNNPEYY